MYKYITEFNNINYLNVFYQCTRVDNVIVMSSEVIQITELGNFYNAKYQYLHQFAPCKYCTLCIAVSGGSLRTSAK